MRSTFISSKLSSIFGYLLCLVALLLAARLITLMLHGRASYSTESSDPRVSRVQQMEEHGALQIQMKERIDLIRIACNRYSDGIKKTYRKYFDAEFDDKEALHLNPDFLVAREQNIGWCKIPKVGSTSMVQSLLRMLGRHSLISSLIRSKQHTYLRRFMPPARSGETFQDLVAIMIVRHPFHRILSAYRDKIINKNDSEGEKIFPKFRSEYNIPIIRKYRQYAPSDSFYKDAPTFPEFVDYLLNTPPTEYNEHWRPYFLVCLPCHINYKVILHLETIQEEYSFLVEQTGFPDLKPLVSHSTKLYDPLLKETAVDEVSKNYTVEYYSQIPKSKLKQLYEIYKIDFEMFGYDYTPFHQFTSS